MQVDSSFCAILDTASLELTLPVQSVPQAASGETIGSLAAISSVWSLAQCIDHPPERPA